MAEDHALIDHRRDGAVAVIALARPEKFNCLGVAMFDQLHAALRECESDGTRVILLRGQGKNFCTGADLPEVKSYLADPDRLQHFINRGHEVLCAFEASRLPVVVAIQGLCLAGGMELMLACDIAFAADTARFGDQHARFGLVPGWGGSQRLPRIVGLRRAAELFFSASWISAEKAEAWGLLNRVVPEPELEPRALSYCHSLCERSAPGLAAMKRLARAGLEGSLKDGLVLEQTEILAALTSADVAEGVAAFEGRRDPVFG